MLFFYIVLFISWILVKFLWGDKPAKYSLFGIVPLGVYFLPSIFSDEDVGLGLALSLIYGILFLIINFICFMVAIFRNTDWSDPENQRAFLLGMLGRSGDSSGSFRSSSSENGSYVIQYRNQVGGGWIDGPSSNDEYIAESMFDRFIENDSRANRRCRLVHKVNGRVKSVLSTN